MNRRMWIVLLWAANAMAQVSGFRPLSSPEISRVLNQARNGSVESQLRLGTAYQFGLGVDADLNRAEYWLKIAAGLGDPQAQTQLAVLYLRPEFASSRDQAMRWFLRAASGGSVTAEHNLGVMYMLGTGVKPDVNQAMFWFRRAAEHGLEEAQINVGILLTSSQDSVHKKEGFQIISSAVKKGGSGDTENALAYCYEHGAGTEANLATAVEWYKRAAKHGSLKAMKNLADMYYTGIGVEKNLGEAFHWSKKACEAGELRACPAVVSAYANGNGVDRNDVKAYQFALMIGMDDEKVRQLGERLPVEARNVAADEAERWRHAHAVQLSTSPQ